MKVNNILYRGFVFRKTAAIFGKLKLRSKLAISYFFATIIPIAAIGFILYRSNFAYVKEQNVTAMYNTQQQYAININNKLDSYVKLSDFIYFNPELRGFMIKPNNNYYKQFDFVKRYLNPVFSSLVETTGRSIVMDLIVFEDFDTRLINNNYDGVLTTIGVNQDTLGPNTKTFNVFSENTIDYQQWYKEYKNSLNSYVWTQVGNDNRYNNLSFMRPLMNLADIPGKKIGLLKMTVRIKDIIEYKEISQNESEQFQLVFDRENRLLSTEPSKVLFYENYKKDVMDFISTDNKSKSKFMKDYVMIEGNIDTTGWKILSVNSMKMINQNAGRMRSTVILSCLAAVIVLFAITFVLSSSFSNRIIRISNGMKEFYKGNLNAEVTDNNDDEIGYLAETFNKMIRRINALIRDNYQANIDKKEAQLKVLQAQINPHFLYNSLSIINRLGNIKDSENITKMVRALTTFYRMTLNKGKEIISISDELSQVKAYIDVYKIRKGEEFNVYYRIDEKVLSYHTIKVILQPFVENVLEHAVFIRESPVNLIISAEIKEDTIVFKIIDDGVGMKREELQKLFIEGSDSRGYGIKNVDDRIKLQFGDDYGVRIFSRSAIGTTVAVNIPKYKKSEE